MTRSRRIGRIEIDLRTSRPVRELRFSRLKGP